MVVDNIREVEKLENELYNKLQAGDYQGALSVLNEYLSYTQKPENFSKDIQEVLYEEGRKWKKVISLAQEEGWDGIKAVEEYKRLEKEVRNTRRDMNKVKKNVESLNELEALIELGEKYGLDTSKATDALGSLGEYMDELTRTIEDKKRELLE